MDHFEYQHGQLYAEQVPLSEIAHQYGTPCYIYSRATLTRHWHVFDDALGSHPHLICYSVKANSNLAVLNLFARLGSGFDVVSIGELERVIAAKGDPAKVVFSGVGKQDHEMRRALELGILCFNIESATELIRLNSIAAEFNIQAPVSLRINPDIDAKTHPYIATGLRENKFGIRIQEAKALYQQATRMNYIKVVGMDCHIGSQLTELSPILETLAYLLRLKDELKRMNIPIKHINLGGGLGVRYNNEMPPQPAEYASAIRNKLAGCQLNVILEPGRAIAANAGILLTQVQYLKNHHDKHFAIVDASMNDFIRPALYQAWHNIIPVSPHQDLEKASYDIVGPVCESGDFLGKDRMLALKEEDLLAVRGAGAYGFSMSSNYNSRPRACEIMVDGASTHLIRRRETVTELYANELLLP